MTDPHIVKGQYTLVIMCGCAEARHENRHRRLGDGRCVLCPHCNTLFSRWGNRITCAGWFDGPYRVSPEAREILGVDNPVWS